MKQLIRVAVGMVFLVLLFVQVSGQTSVARADGPVSYFPTASTTDGRFLGVATAPEATLAGTITQVEFLVPAAAGPLTIGIFDGDIGGTSTDSHFTAPNNFPPHWDKTKSGNMETNYQVFADPSCVGTSLHSIQNFTGIAANATSGTTPGGAPWSTTGANMLDNDWWELTINTAGEALNASVGSYCYQLQVSAVDPLNADFINYFKLRSSGTIYIVPNTTWGFEGAIRNALQDDYVIYPTLFANQSTATNDFFWQAVANGQTTYDGNWKFYVQLPTGINDFPVWGGDFDFGTAPSPGTSTSPDGLVSIGAFGQPSGQTIAPCVDNGAPPDFPSFPYSSLAIANSAAQPNGGDPPDDGTQDFARRSPCVNYTVVDPSNVSYHNTDPSGNQKWSLFDVHPGPTLPHGTWHLDINGLDMDNLSFFHLPYDVCGMDANNQPVCPPIWGSIGDFVWKDLNANGIQDSGEPGIGGVTVTLYASDGTTVLGTTTTAADGSYLFTNLPPATYVVKFSDIPAGYAFTTEGAGTDTAKDSNADTVTGITASIPLDLGQADLTIDAGLKGTLSLGDFVWVDTNGNGIQDTEPGLNGVTVNLLNSSSVQIATTTTANNGSGQPGYYLFSNLVPGTYTVQFVAPTGYTFITKYVNGSGSPTAGNDSNANSSGKTDAITLNSDNTVTINSATGGDHLSIDAGLKGNLSLGDFVWVDTNGNGTQDTEPGLNGVTVNLLNSSSVQIATTTTANNGSGQPGYYLFSNLVPGTYYVQFVAPTGYTFITKYVNGSGSPIAGNDSNANSNGKTDAITLNADGTVTINSVIGGDHLSIDAGLKSMVCVPGTVWNFKLPTGNLGNSKSYTVNGLTITVYGFLNASTPTALYGKNDGGDENGIGIASDPAGDHEITTNTYVQLDLSNLISSGATNAQMKVGSVQSGESYNVYGSSTLGSIGTLLGSANRTLDDTFFNIPSFPTYRYISVRASVANVLLEAVSTTCTTPTTAALGDFVWEDKNANGIQDSGATPLPVGVTVNLLGSNGTTVLATTTTDANGKYLFSNLAAGTYYVQFIAPSGYVFTQKNAAGSTAANDSNANPGTGKTDAITLNAGQTDLTIDAGLYKPAALGDYVWKDLNGDGNQDSGEPGVSGLTVKLLSSNGTTVLGTTTTDANGLYHFTNLAPGTYYVLFAAPSGYTFTTKNAAGSTTANDSNAIVATGKTDAITLVAGQTDNTIDAGLVLPARPASLGDFVWNDTNNNGIQDAGEPGVPGVVVNLLNNGGTQIATATTDANGKYSFTNLTPGTYSVQFVLPGGYAYGKYLQGTNSGLDSNANPANNGKSGTISLASGQNDLTWDAGLVIPDCSTTYLTGSIKINTTNHTATGTIINTNTSASYLVGIASYAVTDNTYANQILWDSKTATIGPKTSINLTVNLAFSNYKQYATQVDLFCGPVLSTLNGQLYNNRKLDFFNSTGWPYAPVGLKP